MARDLPGRGQLLSGRAGKGLDFIWTSENINDTYHLKFSRSHVKKEDEAGKTNLNNVI